MSLCLQIFFLKCKWNFLVLLLGCRLNSNIETKIESLCHTVEVPSLRSCNKRYCVLKIWHGSLRGIRNNANSFNVCDSPGIFNRIFRHNILHNHTETVVFQFLSFIISRKLENSASYAKEKFASDYNFYSWAPYRWFSPLAKKVVATISYFNRRNRR